MREQLDSNHKGSEMAKALISYFGGDDATHHERNRVLRQRCAKAAATVF